MNPYIEKIRQQKWESLKKRHGWPENAQKIQLEFNIWAQQLGVPPWQGTSPWKKRKSQEIRA